MKEEEDKVATAEEKEDMLDILRDFLFSHDIRSVSIELLQDPIEPVTEELSPMRAPDAITFVASTRKGKE